MSKSSPRGMKTLKARLREEEEIIRRRFGRPTGMMDNLESLEELLAKGIRLAMQPSLGRRSPNRAAVPYVVEARDRLKEYIDRDPNNANAWKLLSRAHEVLMNYQDAVSSLGTAMKLEGQRSRKDLKRMASLREQVNDWQELPLTPSELASLGDFLRERNISPHERSLRWTEEWLELDSRGFSTADLLDAFRARGASSDFQVLYNIVRG